MTKKPKQKPKKRKKTVQKVTTRPPKPPPATTNGKLIQDVMLARSVKGDYRDFILIAGSSIIDWIESWDAFTHEGAPVGIDGLALIHKSRVGEVLGEKFADKFWNKSVGCRVHPTQEKRANAQ